jgi:type 1 glutamine amidotransferase
MLNLARATLSLALLSLGCGGLARPADRPTDEDDPWPDGGERFRVLLFSRTAGFRHDSIPVAIAAIRSGQRDGGYRVEATEDPSQLTAENLARFHVVVFLMTTGDVLDDAQQSAFAAWMNAGGAYLGVHSASDTEYDWPFYGDLVGAYFARHPDLQTATVTLAEPSHPAVARVPSPWVRHDEWYDFRTNPRGTVTVLATVDEATYSGGGMGADHPMVWAHEMPGGGRAFYTGMGHTSESWAEPAFRQHIASALDWLAGR